jgi:hypothetical protein
MSQKKKKEKVRKPQKSHSNDLFTKLQQRELSLYDQNSLYKRHNKGTLLAKRRSIRGILYPKTAVKKSKNE